MPKRIGLPEDVKMKHDYHLVDEISSRTKTSIIRNVPTNKIVLNQQQPRKDVGDLDDLKGSIKEKGILEPIIVRPKDGCFEIIAGERRYRAAVQADLKEIPCIEHDVPDNEAVELSIVENIQRKDLNAFEEAFALKSLAEIYGYTHQEIAQKIGKSRVTVSELIRLTDIPPDIINKCIALKIDSKTFLLELVKLKKKKEMLKILQSYAAHSFSREKIKEKRKGVGKEQEKTKISDLKLYYATRDKSIKIKFDISKKDIDKNELIALLEKIIKDIKGDRFKGLE